MADHSAFVPSAAAEFQRVAASLTPDDLTVRTPCEAFDVRGLLNHLLYWGPWLLAAGRQEEPPAVTGGETDVDLVTGDWAAALENQTKTLVHVFSASAAWTGMTSLGRTEMPSSVVGEMVLGEFVLHGWDLARAVGRDFACAAEIAAAVHAGAVAMGAQAREMGVYGPEVAVPESAPMLDRALGATGRDPLWKP
ncbi:TIGR03086 family metal-binding protein [Amycolatopsis sp. NPDC058986]|uniref:TIGR03086 family metal-binding protein n=1 Tax=unclassified Amycolatopsis TaxID=2618356 RepID=UPI003670C27D